MQRPLKCLLRLSLQDGNEICYAKKKCSRRAKAAGQLKFTGSEAAKGYPKTTGMTVYIYLFMCDCHFNCARYDHWDAFKVP